MARQWIIGALLLGCVLLGHACRSPNQCVSRDRCLVEAPVFFYRSAKCEDPYVCCAELSQSEEQEGPEDVDPTTEPYIVPENFLPSQRPNKPAPPKSPEDGDICGWSNRNGLGARKQVSADQARPGQFPWTIALFSNDQYLNGGSLVAPGVVLTAAHLLRRKTEADIVVRAGDWDLSVDTEEFPYEQREVEKIVRHEGFVYSTGANNLALLVLKTPFEIQEHIRTICLPRQVKSFEGKRCKVAGWGRRSFPDPRPSSILKNIDLPMVNSATCQRQLKKTVMGPSFTLAPSLICAGGELDRDACLGDGGSALFCALEEDPDRYEQVGIVNWGIECGKQDVPATYTNVAMFREWIDQHLAEANDQPTGFHYRPKCYNLMT